MYREFTFKDCYARWDAQAFCLGNQQIERSFLLYRNTVIPFDIWDKTNNFHWRSIERNDFIPLRVPFLENAPVSVKFYADTDDNDGLSAPFLRLHLIFSDANGQSLIRKFTIFPSLPFVSMQTTVKCNGPYRTGTSQQKNISGKESSYDSLSDQQFSTPYEDCVDSFTVPQGHYQLHTVKLTDQSDHHDYLAEENTVPLYHGRWGENFFAGNLFIAENYIEKKGLYIIKNAPTSLSALHYQGKDLLFTAGKQLQLIGSGLEGEESENEMYGYGDTVGVGDTSVSDLWKIYRDWYSAIYLGDKKKHTYIMSNTWGDRNQDKIMCHAFIKKEIDIAAVLGADIVQLDDGWQSGITANSAIKSGGIWEGYYSADNRFWTVDRKKFPEGLTPLSEYAEAKGIELALWFSPDSSDSFSNWEKDAETLLRLSKEYHIQYFKLDGVNILSKKAEYHYFQLLQTVHRRSHGKISFNLDITAQHRPGYLYFPQYGTLFVENRYTDFASYLPHATMKNLWNLCRYFPAKKYQFELLNNERNKEKYGEDPLAPKNYSPDYLFALTMPSNPLLWMEMSCLSEKYISSLQKIISCYREHRERLFSADITPIGAMASGTALTGFCFSLGDCGYFLLFREPLSDENGVVTLPHKDIRKIKITTLAASGKWKLSVSSIDQQKLEVSADSPASYCFAEYQL